MVKKAQQKTTAQLRYPLQYIRSCMVNRYHVDHQEGFTLVSFGLINSSNALLDQITCVLPVFTLTTQKENLIQYSDKLGKLKERLPAWKPAKLESDDTWGLPVIDFMHLTQFDDTNAEICFWNFSQGQAADAVRGGWPEPLIPFGVALIRCHVDILKAFLEELYPV